MEILFTAAYVFFIWLVHFRFRWLKFNIWVAVFYCGLYALAILIDIIVLGQVAPYSSEAAVDGVVLQLQPKWSGYIQKVYVSANTPLKKGTPILTMDTTQWTDRLNKHKAELVKAKRRYEDAVKLTPSGAMRQEDLPFRKSEMDKIQAEVNLAEYNLKHATTYAPADGYIPMLFIKPGQFLGFLNKNALPYICTDELWIVAKLKQQSVQCVEIDDPVEIALDMYPGTILNGKVDEMIWAQGNVQFFASGTMPLTTSFQPSDQFFVKIKVDRIKEYPIHFGASGKLVIYTNKSPGFFRIIRRIEIRCESLLNYIYNPFS